MSENDVENVPMFDIGINEKENIKLFVRELKKNCISEIKFTCCHLIFIVFVNLRLQSYLLNPKINNA